MGELAPTPNMDQNVGDSAVDDYGRKDFSGNMNAAAAAEGCCIQKSRLCAIENLLPERSVSVFYVDGDEGSPTN